MGRPAKARYSEKYGCWVTSSLGEVKRTKSGREYRTLTRIEHLRHPTRDEVAAQAWLHARLERERVRVLLGDDITFRRLAEYYMEDAEKSGRLGAEAFKRSIEHLNRFGEWPAADDPYRMYARPCRQIAAEDVEAFVTTLISEGLSESYVSEGLLKTVKACFAWAARVRPGRFEGLPIETNPIKAVKGPKVKRRPTREESPENVHALVVWLMKRARRMGGLKRRFARVSTVLLYCLAESGARPKEMCSARWTDWKAEADGWSTITLDVWKNAKKTGEVRTIALPPGATRRIGWIKRQEGRHPTHIFTHRRDRGSLKAGTGDSLAGEPWVPDPSKKGDTKSLQKWFYRVRGEAIAAGVPIAPAFRLYWNRSMFSTQAQRRGVPRALLARALGTSEAMLDRNYSDFNREDVLGVARAARERSGG
jgi:integrase